VLCDEEVEVAAGRAAVRGDVVSLFAQKAGAAERANLEWSGYPSGPSSTCLSVVFDEAFFELPVTTRACSLFNHVELNVGRPRCIPVVARQRYARSMRVRLEDGCRLFVEVAGFSHQPVDGKLVERPTLILLHGGPGLDHATFKLGMTDLSDVAQVVLYDHRGHGRSDRRTVEEWTLDMWADDVVRLCDALGIEKPIVLGNSFGGFVAQRYMGRHPAHPGKVVLSSTAARFNLASVLDMFERLGGTSVRAAAEAFWLNPTPEHTATYLAECGPHYTQTPGNLFQTIETIQNGKLFAHWNSTFEQTMDLREDLAKAVCPVLVLGGELDPVTPIESADEIAAHLPSGVVQYERFDGCGHGVFRDDPTRAFAVLREFITN
jgi:pimeloyl-ACP methyl ester carboxylesterase